MSRAIIHRALAQAEKFVTRGAGQLLENRQPDSRYLVSAAPVPTALAIIALSLPGINCPALIEKAVNYLESCQLADGGWGNVPEGPANPLATAICSKGIQAAAHLADPRSLLYDAGYLIAKTWTQDFDRLAPEWLPKQNSPILRLIEAISGRPLVPTLNTLDLNDLGVISHYMPPYGRPTILAVTLIKAHYREGLTQEVKEAALHLASQRSQDGSWCQDIVVTALAMMALYLAEVYEPLAKAAQWLVDTQYDTGGWPSFNQLTNWALGWTGYLLGPNFPSLQHDISDFLLKALNSDSSLGTAPPYAYPDLDDTAIGLLALSCDTQIAKGQLLPLRQLLLRLQNRDGSWSTFPSFDGLPPDNTCKFPVYIKSEDITAHVLLSLVNSGLAPNSPQVTKGVNWLIKRQKPDGSWNSTWFLGQTYATAQVIDLLLDLEPQAEALQTGIATLMTQQNSLGAWETGSAGETGLALYTLLRTGLPLDSPQVTLALDYLLSLQQSDGSFKPFYSGFYASGLYYEEPLSEALAAARALRYYLQPGAESSFNYQRPDPVEFVNQ